LVPPITVLARNRILKSVILDIGGTNQQMASKASQALGRAQNDVYKSP